MGLVKGRMLAGFDCFCHQLPNEVFQISFEDLHQVFASTTRFDVDFYLHNLCLLSTTTSKPSSNPSLFSTINSCRTFVEIHCRVKPFPSFVPKPAKEIPAKIFSLSPHAAKSEMLSVIGEFPTMNKHNKNAKNDDYNNEC
jgi:hypothetical protein